MSDRLVISLGSNTPDRRDKIAVALRRLQQFITVLKVSEPYESPDFSGLGNSYINIVVLASAELSLTNLEQKIKTIEADLGRIPQSKSSGIMPVDIDIVLWNDRIIDADEYSRPHFQHIFEILNNYF